MKGRKRKRKKVAEFSEMKGYTSLPYKIIKLNEISVNK